MTTVPDKGDRLSVYSWLAAQEGRGWKRARSRYAMWHCRWFTNWRKIAKDRERSLDTQRDITFRLEGQVERLHEAYNRQCEVALKLYELGKTFRELERDLDGIEGLPEVATILVSDEAMLAEQWPLRDAFHQYAEYVDHLAHELDR